MHQCGGLTARLHSCSRRPEQIPTIARHVEEDRHLAVGLDPWCGHESDTIDLTPRDDACDAQWRTRIGGRVHAAPAPRPRPLATPPPGRRRRSDPNTAK